MPDLIVTNASGILGSIVASLIFIVFVTIIRPRITISGEIAKVIPLGREIEFQIKVVNHSRWAIVDIWAELHLLNDEQSFGGIYQYAEIIPLQRDHVMIIAKFNEFDKQKDFAFRFSTSAPLDEIWVDDTRQYLRFRVYSRHSLSGIPKVHRQLFKKKHLSLKEGDFEIGTSMKIRPQPHAVIIETDKS